MAAGQSKPNASRRESFLLAPLMEGACRVCMSCLESGLGRASKACMHATRARHACHPRTHGQRGRNAATISMGKELWPGWLWPDCNPHPTATRRRRLCFCWRRRWDRPWALRHPPRKKKGEKKGVQKKKGVQSDGHGRGRQRRAGGHDGMAQAELVCSYGPI